MGDYVKAAIKMELKTMNWIQMTQDTDGLLRGIMLYVQVLYKSEIYRLV